MQNTKSATVIARMEPQIKLEAEQILDQIGIPASIAINIFYKKIIQERGLPFSLRLDNPLPPELETQDETTLNQMLSIGLKQAKNGEGRPSRKVTNKLRKDIDTWQS